MCRYHEIPFIVISEVYGFLVGARTAEGLLFRRVISTLGIGYAGAFNAAPKGKLFIAIETMSDPSLASHFVVSAFDRVQPNNNLLSITLDCLENDQDQ